MTILSHNAKLCAFFALAPNLVTEQYSEDIYYHCYFEVFHI